MAPEILDVKKYKKPADIFSFAVTMYEILSWTEPYPISQFQYPWSVEQFVSSGKRLPQLETMTNKQFELIEHCWDHEITKRWTINQIVDELEVLLHDE